MKFQDLQKINARYADALKQAAAAVIDSGWYLSGQQVAGFESRLATYLGVPHVVACGNGLDALRLILRAYVETGKLSAGDEVIVPANTYVATVLAITDNHLTPRFVEPSASTHNLDSQRIESAMTSRTRAVLPVHLYGRCCWDTTLVEVARAHHLLVVEDAAQAMGAEAPCEGLFGGRKAGALGHAAGISFYPSKNLGALGDGGAVATHDAELAQTVRALANYGSERRYYNKYRGYNSRLDELQAAFLTVKLAYLDEDNRRRRRLAALYDRAITAPDVIKPLLDEGDIYHQYVVRVPHRQKLIEALRQQQIPTLIHYPVPPHKQACYACYHDLSLPLAEQLADEVLSLPISPVMSEEEVLTVAQAINEFYKKEAEARG